MNWRANLSTELTDGRPATGKRHANLICQTFYISFACDLPQGYVIIYSTYPATSTIVLWLIHFLSTKNDYAIPRFVKSNRPLSCHYAISTSNSMCQFKTYTTQLKRKMSYQNI